MCESLRCKKCDTPLVIIPGYINSDSVGLYIIQELFCLRCGVAHAEVIKND